MKAKAKTKVDVEPGPGEDPPLAGRSAGKPWWVVSAAPGVRRRAGATARRGRGGKARVAGAARGGAAATTSLGRVPPGQSLVGRAVAGGAPGDPSGGRIVAYDQELRRWRIESSKGELEGWLPWNELKPRLRAGLTIGSAANYALEGHRGAKRSPKERQLSMDPPKKKSVKRFSLQDDGVDESPKGSPLLVWSPEPPHGARRKFSPHPEDRTETRPHGEQIHGERIFFLDPRQVGGSAAPGARAAEPSLEQKKVVLDFDGLESDVEDPPTPEVSATSEEDIPPEEPRGGGDAPVAVLPAPPQPETSGSVDQASPKRGGAESSPPQGGGARPEHDDICSPVVQFSNEFSCEAAEVRGPREDGADHGHQRGETTENPGVPERLSRQEDVGDCAQDQACKIFDLDDFLGDVLEDPDFGADNLADVVRPTGSNPGADEEPKADAGTGEGLRLPSLSPRDGPPRLGSSAGRTPPQPGGEEAEGTQKPKAPEQEESPTTPLVQGGEVKHSQHARPASVPNSGARKRLLLSSVDREKMEKEVCTMILNRKLIQHHEAGASWASCDVVGRPLDRLRVTELQRRFRKIEEEAENVFNNVEMERIRVKAGQDFERLKTMRSSAQPSRWQRVPRKLIVIAPRPPACKSILKSSKLRDGSAKEAPALKRRVSFKLSSEGSGAADNSAAGEEEVEGANQEAVTSREPSLADALGGGATGELLASSLELGLTLD